MIGWASYGTVCCGGVWFVLFFLLLSIVEIFKHIHNTEKSYNGSFVPIIQYQLLPHHAIMFYIYRHLTTCKQILDFVSVHQ